MSVLCWACGSCVKLHALVVVSWSWTKNGSTVNSLKWLWTGDSSHPDYWDESFLSLGTELLLRTLWLPEWGLQTQGATGLRPLWFVRVRAPFLCALPVWGLRTPFLCELSVWGLRPHSHVGCRCEYFSHICAVWFSPLQCYYDLNLKCPPAYSCFRCLPQPEALFLKVLETLKGGI